jgi:diaminohydroxyphosphoribosylaminopyrimidine deaminase / 5-amino-6-(5-phosphoribosylamino)uracil reductase
MKPLAEPERKAMAAALLLAERGRGYVEPNPMVGAVVLDASGVEIAVGWHPQFGGPHAEIVALDQAGDAAQDGTLVITLEPCSHHGKTPPCVDRIIAAGIKRVVAAMEDPFPEVAGKGFVKLQEAGVAVEVGLMEVEARALNAPYLCLLEKKRPYFRAKWAMTADGKTAAVDGSSKWITSEEARRHAHVVRGMMDAIVVGVGTILADDPLLTSREKFARKSTRVVVDSRCLTPLTSRVVMTADDWPTMIVVGEQVSTESTKPFSDAGCEILRLPLIEKTPPPAAGGGRPPRRTGGGTANSPRVSLTALAAEMGRRRWTNALIEGGAELLGGFLTEGLIDAVDLYLAPKLLGGRSALGPVGGEGLPNILQALQLEAGQPQRLGDDLYWPMRMK